MKTAVILSSCRSRSTRPWHSAHSFPVATLNWLPLCMVCSAIPSKSFRPHPLQRWPRCRLRGKELRRRLPMFPANTNSVKLKKNSFLGKVSTSRRRFLCGSTPWAKKLRAGEKRQTSFRINDARSITCGSWRENTDGGFRERRILRINNF